MSSTLTIRMDAELKESAQNILNDIGLDLTTAVKLFLRQTVIQQKLPIELVTPNYEPSNIVKTSMKETAEIKLKNPRKLNSASEVFKDIGV
ncbi:MAG: type II toxin-antitoxin system RelB/DinJ family antitoxin [Campylobacteraceae bacterium]|jgi:DNA-damage-inducible protein J|nr:type II toxin-antitoxin system RelB/DinJ family antitoxin [Campylobacteraceae bacterium]